MVVKMMKWRPWPPSPVTKKYSVKVVVRRMNGFDLTKLVAEKLKVEIRWKGPKTTTLGSFRRRVNRDLTKEVDFLCCEGNVVVWDEEFECVCSLSVCKDNVFYPWEIGFTLFNNTAQGSKNKVPAVGTAFLNIAEYASATEQNEFEIGLPLMLSGNASEGGPTLYVSLSLLELITTPEAIEPLQKALVPVPTPPRTGEAVSTEKDEFSVFKAGLRKILTGYTRKEKKTGQEGDSSEDRGSPGTEDGEYNYPFDSESFGDSEEGESDEIKEDSGVRKSFNYGSLAHANCAGMSFFGSDEDWVYYSNHCKLAARCSRADDSALLVPESKRSILPWKRRKLDFKSPKARGEPLLNKANAEEGGDDIDFDRRQLSSDEAYALGDRSTTTRSSFSDFGDDNFAVGSWEPKEIVSRDGQMKLQTQVFFASIDQRSERAAGESACTVLVAVIADWFQNNRDHQPVKSQLDSLIREGSLEWRKLCENEVFRERFPDKHFDLETVLEAKIRSLSVLSEKSFIGFFHPEGIDEEKFNFLYGVMSFDDIWDEISSSASECLSNNEPQVYIVSWNDHFFILKVEAEAFYVVDTLGERLYEGCNEAYILKFDRNTIIHKSKKDDQSVSTDKVSDQQNTSTSGMPKNRQVNAKEDEQVKNEEEWETVCQGKDACKEYIKSFLAAIPIRELQADIRNGGSTASTLFHQRLQIEFHYTKYLQPLTETTNATESDESSKIRVGGHPATLTDVAN